MALNVPIVSAPIATTKAPALPLAGPEYEQPYQNQNINAFRIYFNQVDTFNTDTIQAVGSNTTAIWLGAGF